MQNQYINEMLDIPELQIRQILTIRADEVHIEVTPVAPKQCCPICRSDEFVILKGNNGVRKVRHLSAFEKKVYLLLSAIRMHCSKCEAGFVWDYLCVGPKKRYSHLFRERAAEQALGSTAAHSAHMQQAPSTTVQQMHNEFVPQECERLAEQAWKQAKESGGLVLGVDDFAIKKGHTYNTGIHDLKGEMMLELLPGRKLEDLRAYAQHYPEFLLLEPKAVVMDLARAYHTWIRECFQNAIRIADHFHVHGYVIEAVQEVRKTVQHTLAPESKKCLDELLSYSPLLQRVWEWKEAFTVWYDYSPSVEVTKLGFERWCKQGEELDHDAVRSTLKTMLNWQEEIINYHHCRWTNATVEGRHNRIKAYLRRHYFMRNREHYKAGILVECNRNRLR